MDGRNEVTHRFDDVRLEIAAPDDAFLSIQIDDDHRPVGDGGDTGDDGPFELQHNGSRPDAFQCQPFDHDQAPLALLHWKMR